MAAAEAGYRRSRAKILQAGSHEDRGGYGWTPKSCWLRVLTGRFCPRKVTSRQRESQRQRHATGVELMKDVEGSRGEPPGTVSALSWSIG